MRARTFCSSRGAGERIAIIDALRAMASLAVCWFHLTNGNPHFLPPGPIKSSGASGWLGVEVFFVISGFIIPFALSRSHYRLKSYGMFVAKRVIRLDPPYLVSLILILALNWGSSATPGYQGEVFKVNLPQWVLHLGYLNSFFGYPWLNPVFWSLAIEFQYYLAIGLIFPLLIQRKRALRVSLFLVLAAGAFCFPSDRYLFHWTFLFALGAATFGFVAGAMGWKSFAASLITAGACLCWTHGPMAALLGCGTAIIIAFARIPDVPLIRFFASISYSLYLVHSPVGGRVVNLAARFCHTDWQRLVALGVALAGSIAAAWLLYRFVERPAQRWSSSIKYRVTSFARIPIHAQAEQGATERSL